MHRHDDDHESEPFILKSDNLSQSSSHSYTENHAKATSFQTFFTLIKSFIGSGVLSLAYSYKNAGSGISIILTIIIGILTYYCTKLVLDVADNKSRSHKITYAKIAFDELRNFGKYSVEVSIVVMQVGVCIGVFIIANKFLDHAFCMYEVEELCGNRAFIVALCALITIPLSFFNHVHYFFIPNLIAFLFLLIGLGTQIYYNFSLWDQIDASKNLVDTLKTFDIGNIPLLFGVAIYAFEGIGTVFEIRGSMAKPQDFQGLMKFNIMFLMVAYTVFPLLCVISVKELPDIVLFSLPKTSTYYLFVQVGYVFGGLLGYPTAFYPAVRILENSNIMKPQIFDERGTTVNPALRYGFRVFLITVMLLIANFTKSFNLFLNFLGSCVFTYAGFLLPIWIYNRFFKNQIGKAQLILNWVAFGLGTVFGVSGMIISLKRLFAL